MERLTLILDSPDATAALGARLARLLRPGDCVVLRGALGAGKSHLARAILGAAGVTGDMPSPTFTLVQSYRGRSFPLAHADLYRIEDPEEARELGLEDAVSDGVLLVEWPERAPEALPSAQLAITLDAGPSPSSRVAVLTATPEWYGRLSALAEAHPDRDPA